MALTNILSASTQYESVNGERHFSACSPQKPSRCHGREVECFHGPVPLVVADIVRFAVALTFLDTIVEFYDSKDGYQRREVSA